MMGACYMMQYMDKYVLSQATLFNLREDLVCSSLNAWKGSPCLPDPEPQRRRICLDIGRVLFWISRLELAEFLSHRPTAYWKVPQCLGVSGLNPDCSDCCS